MNISIIIPVYNAESFLEKAVDSALSFIEVKEILLIEDASKDNSLEVCRKLAEKDFRVKLYQHPDKGNHGAGASRNLGLEKATQDFISFLDADDYYLPNRFDAEKKLFFDEKTEGVFNAIGTDFITQKGKEEFLEKFKNNPLTTVKKHAEGKDVFYGLLGLKNDFGTFFHLNGLTIRNKSIRTNKLKFNENLRVHQDSDFIFKLAYHCNLKSGNITEAVAMRGVHDENRITKIKTYSQKYNERQLLLWNSVADWAKDKNIKSDYKKHIILKQRSFGLALEKGFQKNIAIMKVVLKYPEILKTKYRFTFLKK